MGGVRRSLGCGARLGNTLRPKVSTYTLGS
jgi:hypothetical protein